MQWEGLAAGQPFFSSRIAVRWSRLRPATVCARSQYRMNVRFMMPDAAPPRPPFVLVMREDDGGWHVRMLTEGYIVSLTETFSTRQEAVAAAAEAFPSLHIDVGGHSPGG
ncbi:hypothetical protein C7414_10826 [Cupriavidus alkaliphilus]|nr:hypothetical protein C7414_10826 [Cupriavidus alkaliphilus]SCB26144.1 hypothetical protein GA0116996_10826 [Cupriavidus alkaliphilus]